MLFLEFYVVVLDFFESGIDLSEFYGQDKLYIRCFLNWFSLFLNYFDLILIFSIVPGVWG